jgi:hypothetical protein
MLDWETVELALKLELRMQASRAIREEGEISMKKLLIALAAMAIATPVWAANTNPEPPTVGHVTGTIDRKSALEYRCKATDNANEISCAFTQIRVAKEGKTDDLQKQIDGMMELVRKGVKPDEIKMFEDMLAILDGKPGINLKAGLEADLKADFDRLSPQEKDDTKRLFTAMLNFSRKPDATKAMELARLINEKEMRTCKVVVFQFTQVFRKASPTTWTVVSDPDAGLLSRPCGIVNLSRFEANRYYGWDYYARKAITNPNANAPGGKCSETFDEQEYKYEPSGNGGVLMNCDYIKFSVL